MLPESKFPVTGGTMQTEEVAPRAQSTGLDGCLTDGGTSSATFQQHLHRSPHIKCPTTATSLPALVQMAVKQEPQEEEEQQQRRRDANAISPHTDAETAPTSLECERDQQQPSHQEIQALKGNPGQAAVETGSRGKTSRGRRKSRWKLKFHHQALPPEYLDHYEASLAQEALTSSPTHALEPITASPAPTSSASSPSPIADVQTWLQRITAMQQELCPQLPTSLPHQHHQQQQQHQHLQQQQQQCQSLNASHSTSSRRSVITSTSSHAFNSVHQNHVPPQTQAQTPSRPPMKYSDLPYMGEITLDNSKPRRGRKPKKADICHLIYKNYGTILPGTPGHEEDRTAPREKHDCREPMLPVPTPFQRTDVQNRISSLLEKRLTQESRRSLVLLEGPKEQDEPLNLCIRDLNQLKIRLLRKHGNVYESGQVKSEASSDGEDIECLGTNFVNDVINRPAVDSLNHLNVNGVVGQSNENNNVVDPVLGPNPGFIYWPNAGVFLHPMALQSQLMYYQKMAQSDKCPARGGEPKEQKIVPKSIYSMMETKSPCNNTISPIPTAPPLPSVAATTIPPSISPRPKRNAATAAPPGGGQPMKRKRSAIFIPPMPTENNNPATEVSICKFKFTGGAKPSLQEKKSLSVDSGGNFRYYSGTGDKSMRGYEFFPREALQQPAGQSGSSAAGAFLSAAGERIAQTPACPRPAGPEDGRRKRKTRKSLQREKLEQTFKEKGFLIQTQQLESAEGATYCKFRQLRKFTRYLFRSWKDYLPGNVRELTGAVPEPEALNGEPIEPETPVPLTGNVANVANVGGNVGNVVDLPAGFADGPRTLPLT